jgi:hypothetical protein
MNSDFNTDFDPIETRVFETLNRQVENTIVHAAPDEAWNKAQAGRRRVRRARQGVSMLCALAMLSAGFGVYKWQTKPQPTEVTFGEESDLHLIPTWLPEGTKMMLQDGVNSGWSRPGETTVWRSGKQVVTLESNTSPGQGSGSSLEQALSLAKADSAEQGQYANWKVDAVNVTLSVAPRVSVEEFERLAKSIEISADNQIARLSVPPLNLPVTYSGPSKSLQPRRQWYMSALAISDISIFANLPSPVSEQAYGSPESRGQFDKSESIEIGGHSGQLSSYEYNNHVTNVVTWAESGWDVQVHGSDKANILKIANGMKLATQQEWDDFPRMNQFSGGPVYASPEERRKATEVAATIEVGSGELKVFAGDLITEDGCVNIKLKGTGDKDEFCLKPTGKPVLWSGVRTIGGKKSVVAIVDLHVDSVALTKESGDASTQIISARSIDDETPAGFVVDTTTEGDKYTWLGVVALPFDGDSPGRIEAFFNTEFDRDAPSGEAPDVDADPNAEAAAGSDTNEEYDAPLKSLGRFEVAN